MNERNSTKALIQPHQLREFFKITKFTIDYFTEWVNDMGFNVPRRLVTSHRTGKEPITLPWAMVYSVFFTQYFFKNLDFTERMELAGIIPDTEDDAEMHEVNAEFNERIRSDEPRATDILYLFDIMEKRRKTQKESQAETFEEYPFGMFVSDY